MNGSESNQGRRRTMSAAVALRTGVVLLAVVLAVATPGVERDAASAQAGPPPVTVMTRNLYLGADLTPIFTAASLEDVAVKAAQVWATVQATDFPARAKLLAQEIKQADPVLVGLQEVSLWRRGEAGVLDGPAAPATIVLADYLAILQSELAAAGAPYNVLVEQFNSDGEVPTSLGYDLRLTQRNVILGKAGLPAGELTVTNPQAATYTTNLVIPTVTGPVVDRRGWTAVDATASGRSFRFVNTHLDSTAPAVRTAQALELLRGPAVTRLPVVLVGDLNSDPRDPAPSAYTALTGARFVDAWTRGNGSAAGPTCCNEETLLNPLPALTTRIDHVLTRPALPVVAATRVGIDPAKRTPAGLWPSDHTGVVATLAP